MKKAEAILSIEAALDERLVFLGFVRHAQLAWRRRNAQGFESLRVDLHKKYYMPRHVSAFSCVFSVCNFEAWPALMERSTLMEAPATFSSSMAHVGGRGRTSMRNISDIVASSPLRAGDYGYSDAQTLLNAIRELASDIERYALPFFAEFSSWKNVLREILSKSNEWTNVPSRALKIALIAMSGDREMSAKALSRYFRVAALYVAVERALFRKKSHDLAKSDNGIALTRLVNSVGEEQGLLDDAGIDEARGDFASAFRRLRQALELNPANEFVEFRTALCHYRSGDVRPAIDALQRIVGTSSIYRVMALELLAMCHVGVNESAAAQQCLDVLNERFVEKNAYRNDVSIQDVSNWYM